MRRNAFAEAGALDRSLDSPSGAAVVAPAAIRSGKDLVTLLRVQRREPAREQDRRELGHQHYRAPPSMRRRRAPVRTSVRSPAKLSGRMAKVILALLQVFRGVGRVGIEPTTLGSRGRHDVLLQAAPRRDVLQARGLVRQLDRDELQRAAPTPQSHPYEHATGFETVNGGLVVEGVACVIETRESYAQRAGCRAALRPSSANTLTTVGRHRILKRWGTEAVARGRRSTDTCGGRAGFARRMDCRGLRLGSGRGPAARAPTCSHVPRRD
jgi:hypothetical protein